MAAPRALLGRAPAGMRPAGQDMEMLDVQSDLYAFALIAFLSLTKVISNGFSA